MNHNIKFDLVIVGAECVGIASAYYALQRGWKVCIIEQQKIGSETRYWSSGSGARQNRVQNNEEYLTKYVLESNKEWKRIEEYFTQIDKIQKPHEFLLKQGALWFGDKSVNTSEGNIKSSNAVINIINAQANTKQDRIDSLYMDKLMQGTPDFMKAFKPYNPQNSVQSEWDTWSGLYQPDGGSVDMKASYGRFLRYAQTNNVPIYDNTTITRHIFSEKQGHAFQVDNCGTKFSIHGSKILLTVGIYTPYFLENIMGEPYLADPRNNQFLLEEYVASYIKIEHSIQAIKIYDSIPNYINFLSQTKNIQGKQPQSTGYGFRHHPWDNLNRKERYVKLGTTASKTLNKQDLNNPKYLPIHDLNDRRIIAAKNFARNRMTHLLPDDESNVHYPCPYIFYHGRQTLLDYLNRTEETIVVQSGGQVGKYYPLLARTAIEMLEDPKRTHQLRSQNDVIGNFINRTRFPITSRVNTILEAQKSEGKTHFQNAIIGAGCSGIYAAYRLNKQKHEQHSCRDQIGNIGVFELSDRISGRLKSFKFQGTTTPMQLGGMRYFPTHHILVNKIITDLGIPSTTFPMSGDPIQQNARLAYLRNDYYHMTQWRKLQSSNFNLHTAYRLEGPIVGMDASQIINFSFYKIITAPENINLLTEVFLSKTDDQITEEKQLFKKLGVNVHHESSWYKNWKNYIYPENSKSHQINLSLRQWNHLKPLLLFRFRSSQNDTDLQKITYPLYKFGFQNVLQAQFGHQAYQFVTEMHGYYSYTSNSSYIDQIKGYRLDFGKATYRTLISGYDQINFAMVNQLISQRNGLNTDHQGIFLHHKLVDILPGKAYGKKYVLVFHVATNKITKKNYFKTPINFCDKKSSFEILPLGKFRPIPDNPDYSQIRFTADRVILGMPKKSVVNLYNEVDLMRKSIEVEYKQIYQQQKDEFFRTFKYPYTNDYIELRSHTTQLNPQQQHQLNQLLAKQNRSFSGDKPLTKDEKKDLQILSRRAFIYSVKPVSNQPFQQTKPSKFNKDPPIMYKNLLGLANSSKYLPSIKIVMNFDRNWWDPNVQYNKQYGKKYKNMSLVDSLDEMRGVSVTDLPTRQTLYFSSGPDNIMLASYNDMITTEFWTALHDNFEKVWHPHSFNASAVPLVEPKYPQSMDIHPAKEVLVHQILKQLSLIHQIDVKEQWVKECIFQFWGNDPYGAGYHGFYSGYDISSTMKCIRKPWKDQQIHVVGQAYSNQNGWVEGCFQTVQRLFKEQLNIPEAVKGYYPGY